jgi:hypothetical protein
LARQPFVSPGLLQNYSPFFSIQCHTPPVLYTQDSNFLTHTLFPSQFWSSHFPCSFWFGVKYFLYGSILASIYIYSI